MVGWRRVIRRRRSSLLWRRRWSSSGSPSVRLSDNVDGGDVGAPQLRVLRSGTRRGGAAGDHGDKPGVTSLTPLEDTAEDDADKGDAEDDYDAEVETEDVLGPLTVVQLLLRDTDTGPVPESDESLIHVLFHEIMMIPAAWLAVAD